MNAANSFRHDQSYIGTVVLVRDTERCDVKVRNGATDLVLTAHVGSEHEGRPTVGGSVVLRRSPSNGYTITDILQPSQNGKSTRPAMRPTARGYDANDGKAGVVYILQNEAFAENIWKIGQSTRSGHARAQDLNRSAGTETPKHFRCVFEHKTLDCGRAEKMVFEALRRHRFGVTRQEYFRVDFEMATRTIRECCAAVDATVRPPPTAVVDVARNSKLNVPQSSERVARIPEIPQIQPQAAVHRESPSPRPWDVLGNMLLGALTLTFSFGLVAAMISGVMFSLTGWALSALGFIQDADRPALTKLGALIGLAAPAGFLLVTSLLPGKKRKNS
jgi:hypothetical protein